MFAFLELLNKILSLFPSRKEKAVSDSLKLIEEAARRQEKRKNELKNIDPK